MNDAFEILSDCAVCRVEGAVVEIVEPGRAAGLSVHARCRLCGYEARLGEVLREGSRPVSPEEARAALHRWASEDGETDLARFCEGGFSGLDLDTVCARLVAGEAISTNFDVLAWLFSGFVGGGVAAQAAVVEAEAPALPEAPPAPPPIPSAARALASVILADGSLSGNERAFADAWLIRQGEAPIAPEDMKVWRPLEVGRPEDPLPLLRALVELVWLDGQRDETEDRVVRELARSWGVSTAQLNGLHREMERRHAPLSFRAWQTLRALFVVESP